MMGAVVKARRYLCDCLWCSPWMKYARWDATPIADATREVVRKLGTSIVNYSHSGLSDANQSRGKGLERC